MLCLFWRRVNNLINPLYQVLCMPVVTTMLLAAAHYLSVTKAFKGTATFICQPAEEHEGGTAKMIEDGLFRDHPVEEIFAVHNWLGLTAGEVSERPESQMARYDTFEINISGKGGHAAMPHDCYDSIVATGQLVVTLQFIVSRSILRHRRY